ncbi:hypothetical protein JD969_12825 [Planctomycetota bacterium]|nr:hypothetical protein JD969_12825 [Planctomycetota bacterium]
MNEKSNKIGMFVNIFWVIASIVIIVVSVILFMLNWKSSIASGQELWSQRQAGYLGGIIGGYGGLFGSVCGGLTLFYKYEWAFKTQIILLYITGALGAAALIVGATLFMKDQPYHVWFPLALAGLILCPMGFGFAPMMHKRRIMIEMQKIQALDAKG